LGDPIIDLDTLLQRATLDHVHDGGEELLVQDLGVLVDGDDGRFHEKSLPVFQGFPPNEDLSTLFLDLLDALLKVFHGLFGVEGATQDSLLEGVSNLDRLVSLNQTINYFVVYLLV